MFNFKRQIFSLLILLSMGSFHGQEALVQPLKPMESMGFVGFQGQYKGSFSRQIMMFSTLVLLTGGGITIKKLMKQSDKNKGNAQNTNPDVRDSHNPMATVANPSAHEHDSLNLPMEEDFVPQKKPTVNQDLLLLNPGSKQLGEDNLPINNFINPLQQQQTMAPSISENQSLNLNPKARREGKPRGMIANNLLNKDNKIKKPQQQSQDHLPSLIADNIVPRVPSMDQPMVVKEPSKREVIGKNLPLAARGNSMAMDDGSQNNQ